MEAFQQRILPYIDRMFSYKEAYLIFQDVQARTHMGNLKPGDNVKWLIICLTTQQFFYRQDGQNHMLDITLANKLNIAYEKYQLFFKSIVVNKPFAGLNPDDVLKEMTLTPHEEGQFLLRQLHVRP